MTQEELSEGKVALIIIDMQYDLTAEGQGVLKHAEELGVREGYDYYHDRIRDTIIPNIQELLELFRRKKKMIVFTKIKSISFSDEEEEEKEKEEEEEKADPVSDLGAEEGVILEEVRPREDELVITKDDPDIFQGTDLDSLLRKKGVNTLLIAGVLTNECVEASVLQAVENGYRVILVEDSTAAFSEIIHERALGLIEHNSVIITSTKNMLRLV